MEVTEDEDSRNSNFTLLNYVFDSGLGEAMNIFFKILTLDRAKLTMKLKSISTDLKHSTG